MRHAFQVLLAAMLLTSALLAQRAAKHEILKPDFHTSDRCLACHNGLTNSSGQDVSIGFNWRASIMANSSRDPYWQASVRRDGLTEQRGLVIPARRGS